MADDSIFNVYVEAQLPVTKTDLAKPTKDFILKLISVFFDTFHLDGYAIKQPKPEQLEVLIHDDPELYEDIISILNMHAAMSGIYERIFFKNFLLIDITSPSTKKTKTLTKFLANFVLYYKNKLPEIEEGVRDFIDRQATVDEYAEKKKDALEKIAASKNYRESQSNYNLKLKEKIEQARKKIKIANSVMESKKEEMVQLEIDRQKVVEVFRTKQAEAFKVNEKTLELQAQVVESPEELKLRLQDLEKQKEFKINERELKYHSIKEKKQLLERREHMQAFIQKESEILEQVLKILNEKKVAGKKLESIIKDQEAIQDEISKLQKNQDMQQNHCNISEITELNQQIEQRLSPLNEQCLQLSKEKKMLELKFQEEQEEHRKVLSQIECTSEEIMILEKETADFLKQCQELYKKEIAENIESSQKLEELI